MTTRATTARRSATTALRASARSPLPSIAAVRPSTTALGTAYELATSRTLARLPFSIARLVNVGGAGDGGVDLRGRWTWSVDPTAPPPRGLLHLPNGAAPSATESARGQEGQGRTTWDVLVQCKAEKSPVGPSPVRELEGSVLAELARTRRRSPTLSIVSNSGQSDGPAPHLIGILVAMNGFSAAALAHAQTSTIPLVMVHLAVGDVAEMVRARGKHGALLLRSASVNKALRNLVTSAFP